MIVGFSIYTALLLPFYEIHTNWSEVGSHAFVLAPLIVMAGVLWCRSRQSVIELRSVELFLFGFPTVFFAQGLYVYLFDYNLLLTQLSLGFQAIFIARSLILTWFALIVGYGMLIPNSPRRCAIVVGLLAVTPLSICGAAAIYGRLAENARTLVFLAEITIWLTTASAIAVYGCHRIEVLRQEASEARMLGQYQLKERLGVGGMGEVYLAEHLLLRRPCTIKLIRPERAGDRKNLLRFEREVQAMATLTNWHTVEIFDYGHADDGTFYYVMEYLPGLTLQQVIKRFGPVPPARAVYLIRQICRALHEAHSIGLIHRDIKPSNILVCARGGELDVAKLLDFGLVQGHGLGKDGEKVTQEGVITGTPAYMSPEQAAGATELEASSDVYSLGAVAYFLLTGCSPFIRNTTIQVLAAHLQEPVTPLVELRADVPSDLQDVVLRCLEKDPARRYKSAENLEQALSDCCCADQWSRQHAEEWWRVHREGHA